MSIYNIFKLDIVLECMIKTKVMTVCLCTTWCACWAHSSCLNKHEDEEMLHQLKPPTPPQSTVQGTCQSQQAAFQIKMEKK